MKNIKSLGQHWLKDREILNDIASLASANTPKDAICLEIGPGLGTLTSSLLKVFPSVIAIEYDPNLAHNLPKSFPGTKLTVINDDFLKYDLTTIAQPYVVAGNIPYYITSPILHKLLTTPNLPQKITLLIQKEVAERIVATPGNHTILSLTTQNYATAELGPFVHKSFFTPPPKVDSQVIVLTPLPQPQVPDIALNLAKLGFSSPRKKLIGNLSASLHIDKKSLAKIFDSLNLDVNSRPADLSLQDWGKLSQNLSLANSRH